LALPTDIAWVSSRRTEDLMHRGRCRTPLAVVTLAGLLVACGGGSPATPTAPSQPAPSNGVVDPALVGDWTGTVDGSFGPGSFFLTLSATGSMSAAGSGNYCSSAGDWGVSAGQVGITARDCTGTVLTFRAPVSSTRLTGTWSASSGRSGTFDCTKQ
jgi:hypothetical protein